MVAESPRPAVQRDFFRFFYLRRFSTTFSSGFKAKTVFAGNDSLNCWYCVNVVAPIRSELTDIQTSTSLGTTLTFSLDLE